MSLKSDVKVDVLLSRLFLGLVMGTSTLDACLRLQSLLTKTVFNMISASVSSYALKGTSLLPSATSFCICIYIVTNSDIRNQCPAVCYYFCICMRHSVHLQLRKVLDARNFMYCTVP